ncbi:hypothetical protein BKE38_19000 [Pseudoroseomonas deserti]|uniref:TNase-like domain-containing protein n=1 Tax=Teichococcus deserti TaxID=1817963 RepID=A0A1V2GYJ5_9PROT|nr:hypothetical protein BKE38_19000 [Pseudoroseomonas deserti]
MRIPLAGIDAPESRQPSGTRARQELASPAFRRDARIGIQDVERSGRTVGTVFEGRSTIDADMARRGAAGGGRAPDRCRAPGADGRRARAALGMAPGTAPGAATMRLLCIDPDDGAIFVSFPVAEAGCKALSMR